MTVHYPWHPHYGETLEVRRFWHNRSASGWICQVPSKAKGVVVPVPAWMTDKTFCDSLSVGNPLLSMEALCELRITLDNLLHRGRATNTDKQKERTDAPENRKAAPAVLEGAGRDPDARAGRGARSGIGRTTYEDGGESKC